MTETETAEPEEDAREPVSLRARLARRLPQLKSSHLSWKQRKDLAVLVIGIVVSGVLTVVGIAHVGWPWLLVLGCAITTVASLATRAAEERRLKERLQNLWQAFIVTLVLLVGIFSYHEWWDPASRGSADPNGHQVMVNGSDTQVLPVYDQAGGSQTYEYPPLNSDEPASLTCYVSLAGSGSWYEVSGDRGWVPQDAVHAIPGTTFPSLPHC